MSTPPSRTSSKTLRIIWTAFLVAPVVYGVLGWILTSQHEAGPLPMPMTAVFAAVAVASAVAGYILPAFVARRRLAEEGGNVSDLDAYQTAMIVRWTCFEAISLYGFVLSFMCYQFPPTLMGVVVSLALIGTSRPQPTDVLNRSS